MDLSVPQELLVSLGKLVSLDLQVSRVKLDHPELLESTVYLVMPEKKVLRDHLDHKENKDLLDPQDSQVSQAREDLPAFQYGSKKDLLTKYVLYSTFAFGVGYARIER